ncbi:IS110 family transposase [Streptomyces sp. RB6PN25]|uniref:IS110 family transposase n=1 Tax=Streptomyces humicola TaxID=2953240 RepID=A0ABT1PT29_9ACTN|nr:IS110 family transposase [Streptomyces humicola]MCQ4079715.1 IS110 family transposase [Streptomyces humicola]
MSRFGSAKAFASRAGVCPGNWESAGKSRAGRSRKGPKWLGACLHACAMAAIRSKDTYLHAQYMRLKPRRGHAKSIKAVQHSIIVSISHMLDSRQPYRDLGGAYFTQLYSPERLAAHHLATLRELGCEVTANPPAERTGWMATSACLPTRSHRSRARRPRRSSSGWMVQG